ncbi:MAG: DUF11 domain-containing protein [Flavobacterium sp.]|uniref:DUF11 domain-containing protein n=1 Tax=Flavobacterium sp. TaxID=239 RepID=UPI002FC72F9E
MKNFIKNILAFLILLLTNVVQSQTQATINNSNPNDAQILASMNGGGMTLSNGQLIRGTRNTQIAIFSNGTQAGFEMDEGILFSTGNARTDLTQRNANSQISNQIQSGTYQDADLRGIFNEATRDVVIYTFNVTLADYTSALRIAFQFGSDEYPNYVGSAFNDAFGFFVTGPNISGTFNMAKIPSNQKPISINTINYGQVGFSGSASYSGLDLTQGALYINNGHTTSLSGGKLLDNNSRNNGAKPVFIEYNGITKLITYDLTGLQPGGTYTFKIAIADASDQLYDSGVLIKKVQGTTGADVKIVKTVDKMNPNIGEEVEFTLTANNLGPYNAPNAKVQDLLPSGYTYVSHTQPTGTVYNPVTGEWTLGSLQAIHQTRVLKIRAKVNEIGVHRNVATISSDDLDPDYSNNSSFIEPQPINPCFAGLLFLEDFGTSNPSVNSGRTTSPYMPTNNGYAFGVPYGNQPKPDLDPSWSPNNPAAIDNGYYAVVAPGYIKAGWKPSNLSYYFWTPSYNDPGAITDASGTLNGAVMAVNGGSQLVPFYEKNITLDHNSVYRAALWLYVAKNPTQIAVDIIDKTTGFVYGEVISQTFWSPSSQWQPVEFYFKVPPEMQGKCDLSNVVISFRNNNTTTQGNDFYVDNLSLAKLKNDVNCYPTSVVNLKCPTRLIITNPMLRNKAKKQ